MQPIKLTYDVPVSPAAAFYLFVGEISQWWPGVHTHDPARFEDMVIEARPGGAVYSVFAGQRVVWGKVVDLEAPFGIHLQMWWRQTPGSPSMISVRFEENDWGSRLFFEHGGWTEENAHMRQQFIAWPIILSHYVAHTRAHSRGGLRPKRSVRGVA